MEKLGCSSSCPKNHETKFFAIRLDIYNNNIDLETQIFDQINKTKMCEKCKRTHSIESRTYAQSLMIEVSFSNEIMKIIIIQNGL